MSNRLLLQNTLEQILGSRNVYYQPPESILMVYPAIVYSRDTIDNNFANDKVYTSKTAYEIIVIDKDPDSVIIEKIALLPTCRFNRNYTINNLNHDVFKIYF